MASIDFIYQNEYQKEISFPLGGIGKRTVLAYPATEG